MQNELPQGKASKAPTFGPAGRKPGKHIFEQGKLEPELALRRKDAKERLEWLRLIKFAARTRARHWAQSPDLYDSLREYYNLAASIYVVQVSKQVYNQVKEKNDSESYKLFLSVMGEIEKCMDYEFFNFFNVPGKEFVQRFNSMKAKFDECSEAFGTPSYELEELSSEGYQFLVRRLLQEVQKTWHPKDGEDDTSPSREWVPGT